jgi:L-glyceraldehyde 3-phosphate reductase
LAVNPLPEPSSYVASLERYASMPYRRSGRSGLDLPALSLGLWHNFGFAGSFATQRRIVRRAFDLGITHVDLANNYGPPPGAAEQVFGQILATDLRAHRDELIVSTKAGYRMHEGPYGEFGSRKTLLAGLDASLRRLGLECVDIVYSHRPDPETPLEETLGAIDTAVRRGKALYAGISRYPADEARRAAAILRELGTPMLIHQVRYSMLDRTVEADVLAATAAEGSGCIVFSPLAQGQLTDRYLAGIPVGSRAAEARFLDAATVADNLPRVRALREIARRRGQSLARMALAWVLRDERITSAIVGASSVAQLDDSVGAIENLRFDPEELAAIERVLAGAGNGGR